MSTPIARTADEALASVSEFPERLGPVLIKELRQGLRSGLFVVPFLVLPAVLALVALWALSSDSRGAARNAIGGFFWVAVVVPVLIITPLRALGSIRSEREAQTLDLLQLTPLTAWRIVFAKWSSLIAQSLLWVVALLPFFVLRYFFGSVNLTEELLQLGFFVLGGAALTAVAMAVSTLPRVMFWLCIAALAFGTIVGMWTLLISFFSRSFFSGVIGTGPGSAWQLAVLLDGLTVHVTILVLALAAARVAPLADNYAARLRLGTISLFAWWGLAAALLPTPMRDGQWFFFGVAAVAITLLAAYELVSERLPLTAHVRPWARAGLPGRWLAHAFMPGWPSAALFSTSVIVLATIAVIVFLPLSRSDSAKMTVVLTAVFGWCAIMLPRGLQSIFNRGGVERPGLHMLLHLAGGLGASILGAFTIVLGDGLIVPGALFPSALFWLLLTNVARWRDMIAIVGIDGAIWVVLLLTFMTARSGYYWRTLQARFASLGPAAKQQPPSSPADDNVQSTPANSASAAH